MTPAASIMGAFFQRLSDVNLGYPIAWPGTTFEPPASGVWLEPAVLPNEGLDNGLGPNDEGIAQGICQVMVWTRPGAGMLAVTNAAQMIVTSFPKDLRLVGLLRVQRIPYLTTLETKGESIGVMVTIPYSQ
jgi:hypothetical protein